jgi:hypothetical protein
MTKPDTKNETKRLKKWLESTSFLDTALTKLARDLDRQLDAVITTKLVQLSSWYGNTGNLQLLEGNKLGWDDIRKSLDCEMLSISIKAACQDAGKYGWVATETVAVPLSLAIASHFNPFANWLGDRIIASLESKADKYKLGPPSGPYYFAFIQFYALWRKKSFNIKDYSDEPLGVYQEILDGWTDEKRYVKACLKACDYHVKRMHDDQGYSEFLGAPQDLLPVEMLMIRRIRDDLGLPNPEIEHPLMQTPLAHRPKELPEVKDELLEKVTARAKAELEHFPVF